MNRDFIPSRDADLLAWSANYSAKITADAVTIGLTAAQATNYATLHTGFASALATATEPSTRTRAHHCGQGCGPHAAQGQCPRPARIINAFPGITNQQRIDLGLNPRDGEISPINPPTESPVMEIVSANGRLLTIKLRALDSQRRGKPAGVDGATVFSFVGSAPPADISLWKFEGSTTRTNFELEFPPTVAAGSQVWLCAFWFNPRSESGPACTPISAYLAGGVTGAIAA